MKRIFFAIMTVCAFFPFSVFGQQGLEKDIIETSNGNLEITFIGHGTLMIVFEEKVVHIDPWTKLADYSNLPKADIILITHEHRDHLDLKALEILKSGTTQVVSTQKCAEQVKGAIVMNNGDVKTLDGLKIEAVPAYNIVHMREPGKPFHPKGVGNGYVITFGNKRVYVGGDTENTPEMKSLKDIDVAFLPMNLPYTMTPEMVADAVKVFKPNILYPYHFGKTDTSKIVALLKNSQETEVRIRKME